MNKLTGKVVFIPAVSSQMRVIRHISFSLTTAVQSNSFFSSNSTRLLALCVSERQVEFTRSYSLLRHSFKSEHKSFIRIFIGLSFSGLRSLPLGIGSLFSFSVVCIFSPAGSVFRLHWRPDVSWLSRLSPLPDPIRLEPPDSWDLHVFLPRVPPLD